MNLTNKTLNLVGNNQSIAVPNYDRDNTKIGIVHLGPGAFHRAHQAAYTENAMNLTGGNWGICGVSLRSPTARNVLAKQDNLYTLAILDKAINYQVIGAVKEVLVASEQSDLVLQRMSAPDTKIVSLTITEKGYCLGSDGNLDFEHKDIKHDLSNPHMPVSAIGFIVEALCNRKANNITAFNVLSCDNVSGNGDKLRSAVLDYAHTLSPELKIWIENQVSFPNSMVDSITPKTEAYTVESVSKAIGAQDEWPIQREQFTQWVIEDTFKGPRPDWHKVGVVFTNDVDGFEKAKLRLLNCLHSTLAYAGSLAGFETVYDVTSDKAFYKFICDLANEEVIGSFDAPKELDVQSYSKEIIERFLNPEIRHLLAQIAWDGSQKLQMRLLPIIQDNLKLNRSIDKLCFSLACWMQFIRAALIEKRDIVDPLAEEFASTKGITSSKPLDVINAFFGIESIFGKDFINNDKVIANLDKHLSALLSGCTVLDQLKQLDRL
ncbi:MULTISPECIES: mannitol dehydrogenase family protein [unclassified Pseudoalteromonas]|uniref:mannitol dehydrogenase family protein n=1 Tax=unclassified Pseudoalteromonas TaxID=194690 RepID=UPI0006948066|nr:MULTISPECIES: mannitol dehydrogenase family protein [unclassified Pseudoalteromonas]